MMTRKEPESGIRKFEAFEIDFKSGCEKNDEALGFNGEEFSQFLAKITKDGDAETAVGKLMLAKDRGELSSRDIFAIAVMGYQSILMSFEREIKMQALKSLFGGLGGL